MVLASVPAGFKAFPLSIAHLSLPVVLKCGQSFRWSKTLDHDNSQVEWRLTLQDRVICLRQTPDTLYYRAVSVAKDYAADDNIHDTTLAWLKDYFQLEMDLVKLFSAVDDPVFQSALSRFEGAIRMLRQDPWETLISFICSQNNHISRITSMVQNLCAHFSPALLSLPSESPSTQIPYYPFPTPQTLADPSVEATLRGLGFGYRAKYIQKTAALLCQAHDDPQKWLLGLRETPTEQAREELLKLPGVGPKVADCILLMSLDKHEVVPIDTHMLQIAMKHYNFRVPGHSGRSVPPMTPKLHAEVSSKLQQIWGSYAGWAHSVLFTADLRAFAEYEGKPTILTPPASPIPLKGKVEKVRRPSEPGTAPRTKKRKLTGLHTPSPSPLPRRVRTPKQPKADTDVNSLSLTVSAVPIPPSNDRMPPTIRSSFEVESINTTLAERIKLRSRARRID